MSAAAKRRAKQLQKRRENSNSSDAVSSRLASLLNDGELDETTAYEALQLA